MTDNLVANADGSITTERKLFKPIGYGPDGYAPGRAHDWNPDLKTGRIERITYRPMDEREAHYICGEPNGEVRRSHGQVWITWADNEFPVYLGIDGEGIQPFGAGFPYSLRAPM